MSVRAQCVVFPAPIFCDRLPSSEHVTICEPRFSALIMAGGRSRRMRVTSGVHKALVEVAGRSLIRRNLETLLAEGFRDIAVAISIHAPEIETYVLNSGIALADSAGATLWCIKETRPLGTIGAARLANRGSGGLLVVNVDNLTTLPLRALVHHHCEADAALTIACHRELFRIPFGQLILEGGKVSDYRKSRLSR